jgi:hypothetical protein
MANKILYAVVLTEERLLAEYSEGRGGDLRRIVVDIVYPKIEKGENVRKTLKQSPLEYHYMNKNGRTYFAVTDTGFNRKAAWSFLNEIAKETLKLGLALDANNCKKILMQKMQWYNKPQNEKLISMEIRMNNVNEAPVEKITKILASSDRERFMDEVNKLEDGSFFLKRDRGGWLTCFDIF